MTCADLAPRAPSTPPALRFAVLAAATLLAAAFAAAVWSAHPPRPGAAADAGPLQAADLEPAPYWVAKIGALPVDRPRSDIPYGR
jgi:hypothetical protein